MGQWGLLSNRLTQISFSLQPDGEVSSIWLLVKAIHSWLLSQKKQKKRNKTNVLVPFALRLSLPLHVVLVWLETVGP
jgi:hypothetical protein